MRAITFFLGIGFLELLAKHWNLFNIAPKETMEFASWLLIGSIILDIMEVIKRR